MKVKKLWEKNYKLRKEVEEFTIGDDYILDQKLIKYDCLASIAHVKMLGKIGILKNWEVKKIVNELSKIIKLDEKGEFIISKEHEDCHTAIENYLTEKLGNLGKKIHVGRSRNDQILTALRLYYKDELENCKVLIQEFILSIKNFVKKYGKIKIPGYTHSRKAMPSSIKLWGSSFIESMEDNLKEINLAIDLINQSPLGTGAGYGIPIIKIDRIYTKKLLNFKKIQNNPIYVQNSRGKFESNILHVLTQIMLDINKIATDLITFSISELGYFSLPKNICTGSSMMPQKVNPDVLELLRAKYHVLISYEFQVKSLIGNLLSGYNRDVQLTKKPIMDGIEITKESLKIATLIMKNLKVNEENCKKGLSQEIYATEKVYKLVLKEGIPFRDAYKIVSEDMKM